MPKERKNREVKKRNFCEVCGMKIKVLEPSSEEVEKAEGFFNKLSALGIRDDKRYLRNATLCIGSSPSFAEFCAIGSPKWTETGDGCRDFQLKLGSLSMSNYIAIHTSKIIARSQSKLLKGGLWVSVIGLFILIFTTDIRSFLISLFKPIFN